MGVFHRGSFHRQPRGCAGRDPGSAAESLSKDRRVAADGPIRAVAVACALNGLTERDIVVHLNGGDLHIAWADDNHVFMTGPATFVFDGKVDI